MCIEYITRQYRADSHSFPKESEKKDKPTCTIFNFHLQKTWVCVNTRKMNRPFFQYISNNENDNYYME